jgi:TonB family protein
LIHNECRSAETLAGAIALGEADDAERQAYRRHVATCAACLRALGGEREIERTMERVASARDAETWTPDVTAGVRDRTDVRKGFLRVAFSTLGACLVVSIGIHLFAVSGLSQIAPSFADPLVIHMDGQRIVLEKRSTAAHSVSPSVPKMIVEHNVVTLSRQPVPQSIHAAAVPLSASKTVAKVDTFTAPTVVVEGDGSVPVWRKGGGGGGGFTTITQSKTTDVAGFASRLTHGSESIMVAPAYAMREAAPLGGETAINPQPAPIAYAQGAEGTSVFEVQIDERGIPTKCTITKPSGYLSLDDAVCKAAMNARYTPRTVNGRPVPGVYRDAFTFRSTEPSQGI